MATRSPSPAVLGALLLHAGVAALFFVRWPQSEVIVPMVNSVPVSIVSSEVIEAAPAALPASTEPETPQDMLEMVVADHRSSGAMVVNLISRLPRPEDQDDPNAVKVAADPHGNALFFSRAPIPSRARKKDVAVYQQTGVISFQLGFLRRFSVLPQTPLEIAESVDMMRLIEHRLPLRVVHTETETIGVDTPQDLVRAEGKLRLDAVTRRYLEVA